MHEHPMHGSGAGIGAAVSAAVLVVGLAATMADVPMAWLVWPLGYGVVLPLAIGYAKRENGRSPATRSAADERPGDQLAQVKEAYVAGKIDETEFERRLEAALEDDAAA